MSTVEKRIIWLASYPKSGNTWFRIFLINLFSDSATPIDLTDVQRIPISSSRNIFDEYSGSHSSDLTQDEISKLRPEVYNKISVENEQEVFLKTHDAWTLTKEGNPVFPEEATKGVIYFVRNPLDVAISYSHHNDNPVEKTISEMNNEDFMLCSNTNELRVQLPQFLGSWSNHVDSWINRSKLPVHIMRYEDMLNNTYQSFSGALQFLGMKFSRTQINSAISRSSFKHLKEYEIKHGFKERSIHSKSFFRKGISEEWKSMLSEPQVNLILSKHSDLMHRFGYLNKQG